MTRQQIAEEILGAPLENGQFAPCPGKDRHTKGDGKRDFRVVLDGAPTGYCFHGSCSDDVAAFNKELRRRIWFAEHGNEIAPKGSWGESVASEPKSETKARPELDMEQVREFIRGVPFVDGAWLARRSVHEVESVKSGEFLEQLYRNGERVLIFADQRTQGDFCWWIGRGGYRMSQERTVKAKPSGLPAGTKEGVWFLTNPVTGKWAINAKLSVEGQPAKWSRRSEGNVTSWRYYVLESDELDTDSWLRVLVNLPIPIAAIYTSGGRSIHALVRMEVDSKSQWDAVRNVLRAIACPLGADPAALSAVRLSRLPGCKRGDRLQKLLYLHPDPDHVAIRLLPEVRN